MPVFQESCAEQIQAQTIIIIHPGSMNLRMGRASDLNPNVLLNAVARKRLQGGLEYKDPILPSQVPKTKELTQAMEESRLQVSHTLQSCLQSDGRRRYATPPQQIAAFNRRSNPETLSPSGGEWIKTDEEVVVGDDILSLNPEADFNIHFPYKRGELNVHSGPGGSLRAVLANLKIIWEHVLTKKMNVLLKDLRHYRAVLVVPDIYNRHYLKELTTLLLCEMGFGGCFLLQDHVAATFGAGLGYACVVDVGDQKTSVSCVEDGISHRNTRVRMDFGGADITQTFFWLLQKCAFPYKTCNASNRLDALLLDQLKKDFCHVDLNVCGSQEKTFIVRQPQIPTEKYTLQVGDECLVAPLSLFQPELFKVTGMHTVHTQKRSMGDPEDPHDENYLRETSRRGAKENLEQTLELPEEVATPAVTGEEEVVVDAVDSAPISLGIRDLDTPRDFVVGPQQLLGLDHAVLQSIDRCRTSITTDDLKRKMYSCILVVGSGMKFQGIGMWLHNRISLQIPYMYRAEQLDIITQPKEMDPGMTAWKGAAILSCLESAQELWIGRQEWEQIGVRILRERAPFMW
ncbi:actin-related protein 8 isoform X1 [Neodiprion virginianus]|uniref:Actin-related protein 8 isoform X1 n=1 Tax=Neodiprion lecontei TaxID=441921 RepID=A0ABM3FZN0_NEOLC|nr:actin-related protein 8 isoform X1 [Neodiprion lecontei]XP_046615160.1 actin-related protein 8 isoform X1 [Neodiprion virginianus]